MDAIKKILLVSSDNQFKNMLCFCFDGWGYEVFLNTLSNSQDIEEIKKISPDAIVIDVQLEHKNQLAICKTLKENFATAFIPIIILIDKNHLRNQSLNLKQYIDDYLIKPLDPLDLRIRIEMTAQRAQHSIYASALTGLPGGKILEEVLRKKFKKSTPFSFAYIDIDNFKSFNDVYGYRKGDGVILQTAHMLFTTLKTFGNPDDFISHIGGDDFVFISTLDKYEQICHNFIQTFERIMPFHYSETDRIQGFVVTRDRTRKIKNIPLMTVSIAVVNREYTSSLQNIIQINDRIAEIKHYLKTIAGSAFMADRRDTKLAGQKEPQVYKRDIRGDLYRPLGQILLERKVISYEQLDEALNIHWRKDIILGEVLKELGFLNEEELQKALAVQKAKSSLSVFQN